MGPKSDVRLFGTASELTQHGKLAQWKSTALVIASSETKSAKHLQKMPR